MDVPAPTAAATYLLAFSNSKPAWTLPYSIGDNGPAGGKVFYLSDTSGFHGLEAAPIDQSGGIQWGCSGTLVGASGTAVGTGKANTAAINAVCGNGTAAQVAASYSLNGFTDWYLPSKDELNLLFQQETIVGGFTRMYYWSSSEAFLGNSWFQYFDAQSLSGIQNSNPKGSAMAVRAIRSF